MSETEPTPPDGFRERVQRALAGTYAIERELGGGGMSHVYLADEVALHRQVVIKVLPPELQADMSTDRFRREVKVAIELQHPNIVPVLTAGQADGVTYYVMPFVKGESLEQRLARGPVPPAETVQILRDVSRALAYAHDHGVVHRDIKPGNIMLTGGAAVVTDFGIAKALAAGHLGEGAERPKDPLASRALTAMGMSVGTPAYMAPEQAAADPTTDARADLYALGVTAYEMLAGRPPFMRKTPRELLVAHLTEPPPPLADRRPDAPPALVALVDQCLAKDPEDRPRDASDVLARLEAIPLSGSTPSVARPRQWRGVAIGALVLALAAAIGFAAWKKRAASPLSPAAGPTVPGAPDRLRLAVMTFEVPAGDTALAAPASLAADLLTDAVAQAGLADVLDRQAVRRAEASAGAGLKGGRMLRELASKNNINLMLQGSLYRLGDTVLAEAQLVDPATGSVIRPLPRVLAPTARAQGDVLAPLRDRLLGALQILAAPTLGRPALPNGALPTDEVAREITAGVALMDAPDSVRSRESLEHLRRAAELDTSLILPQILLADAIRYQLLVLNRLRQSWQLTLDSMYQALAPRRDRMTDFEQNVFDYGRAELAGDADGILAARERAVTIAPNYLIARNLYVALLRVNQPRAAMAALRQRGPLMLPGTLGYQPGKEDPAYWGVMADIQHYLGAYDSSLAAARRGIAADPRSAPALAEAVYAHAALGSTDSVLAGVDQLLLLPTQGGGQSSPVNLAVRVAAELQAHGHADQAKMVYDRLFAWFDTQPPGATEDDDLRFQRVLLLYNAGRYDEARPVLEHLDARDSLNVRYLGLLARIAARQKKTDQADALAKRMEGRIANLGGNAQAAGLLELAFIEAAKGDQDRAVAYLQSAFAHGLRWQNRRNLHWYPDLAPLRDHPGFKALIEPQG